jgi:hypothetical protein
VSQIAADTIFAARSELNGSGDGIEYGAEIRSQDLNGYEGDDRDKGNEHAVFDHRCTRLVANQRAESGKHCPSLVLQVREARSPDRAP